MTSLETWPTDGANNNSEVLDKRSEKYSLYRYKTKEYVTQLQKTLRNCIYIYFVLLNERLALASKIPNSYLLKLQICRVSRLEKPTRGVLGLRTENLK
jgi:hypothetical protein